MNSTCDKGYKGPLCQTCAIVNSVKYAKYDGNKCEACFTQVKETFLLVGSLIAFALLNMFLLRLKKYP